MPLAHLGNIQMKLSLEIVPLRGAARKTSSQPLARGSLSDEGDAPLCLGGLRAEGHGLQGCQRYPQLLAVFLLYCCWRPASPGHAVRLGTSTQRCTRFILSLNRSRFRRGCRKSQQRQMFARLTAAAQRGTSYLALGRGWSGRASGRCSKLAEQKPVRKSLQEK